MGGPLEGVRVIEASAVVSGPFAAMILADQGADVIKIEAPGMGDISRIMAFGKGGLTALFTNCNRGKRSVCLDISQDEGREVALDLVRTADVFIENYRPGVLARLGLGPDDLHAVNPQLISVSITGFGATGPYARMRVYDPIIQCLAGFTSIQVNPEIPFPDLIRNIVCDKATSLTVAQAVNAALFARERGAGGQHLDVPMLDAAMAFFWPDGMMARTMLDEDVVPGPTLYEVYRLQRTADGHLVYFFGADHEFASLCRALDRPDLLEDERYAEFINRIGHLEELGQELADAFESKDTAGLLERLLDEDVASAPVLTLDEVITNPQVVHNGKVREREHPTAGRIREVLPPVKYSATPVEDRPLAPVYGEHTEEVLREVGFGDERLASLRESGIIPKP